MDSVNPVVRQIETALFGEITLLNERVNARH